MVLDLYSALIGVIKLQRMHWAEYVARMRKKDRRMQGVTLIP